MAYITTDEYLRRAGMQETATLTNEARATPGSPPQIVMAGRWWRTINNVIMRPACLH